MKVKIIKFSGSEGIFEELINDFIKDKKIIDIKYQSNLTNIFTIYSALIIYEEIDK